MKKKNESERASGRKGSEAGEMNAAALATADAAAAAATRSASRDDEVVRH